MTSEALRKLLVLRRDGGTQIIRPHFREGDSGLIGKRETGNTRPIQNE